MGAKVSSECSARQNHLLSAFPAEAWKRIFPYLTAVDLPFGKVLCEPGCALRDVYFPVDSIVALLSVLECGASAEISLVGNDGVVGMSALMNGERNLNRAIVQTAGIAFRMPAFRLRQEFDEDPGVRALLLRALQASMAQIAQTAACNRFHTIEQQLCRWLLLSLDRLSVNHLAMTQELIAEMLGVRRESVSEAAGRLRALGIIQYKRGHIVVLDRPGLEKFSCECYSVIKQESYRLHSTGTSPQGNRT